jgi:hypothetical protein
MGPMKASGVFDVSAGPDRVVEYLSNPRNLIFANHRGPVVERSDEPSVKKGSWAVLAFDQLRTGRTPRLRSARLHFRSDNDERARVPKLSRHSGISIVITPGTWQWDARRR